LPLWFFLYVASCSCNWQHREKTKEAIKNGQTREIGNIERKPKEQSKMGKQEQLAT
jgi:Zn-finger protein